MAKKKLDPIELQRMKLEGELDADELRQRKVEAMKRAHAAHVTFGKPALQRQRWAELHGY